MKLLMIGLGIVFFLLLIIVFNYFGMWLRARLSGVKLTYAKLIGMQLRKVRASTIVDSMIMGTKAGVDLNMDVLEAHYMAGGNVPKVVKALIGAEKANIELSVSQAAAIDLAGRDVLEAVRTSVNPKVIDCPSAESGKEVIEAVAGDGIQVRAKARVTVRANLERLVGGATEETIIARVGEGIVSTIGSAVSHKEVLESPELISSNVLNKGLDSGTAFEILSIDISDVDVGRNIGAQLQIDQAEADKNVAQAKAEERRAMAIAEEQEMIAKVQENKAKVVEAEVQIPLAMAQAFKDGNLGVMDYYKMKNIEADSGMRDSISKMGGNKK
ncbi:flotillin-like protein FloA [bacterium]|jgi:uncharacterized protein YqfA (UPF0365 family)|nr:flotillin-like protein FloA [bacterium]